MTLDDVDSDEDGVADGDKPAPSPIRTLEPVHTDAFGDVAAAAAAAAEALARDGFCMLRGGASAELLQSARREVDGLFSQGIMQPGDVVTRGTERRGEDERRRARGDFTLWLDGSGAKARCRALRRLDAKLEAFGRELGERMRADGLRFTQRTDAMVACYPAGGSAYGRHVDNADGDGRADGRRVTVVYYLNDGWSKARDGGALRVWRNADPNGEHADVDPLEDTVAVFRADRTPHEVRPAHAMRRALSMWWLAFAP